MGFKIQFKKTIVRNNRLVASKTNFETGKTFRTKESANKVLIAQEKEGLKFRKLSGLRPTDKVKGLATNLKIVKE